MCTVRDELYERCLAARTAYTVALGELAFDLTPAYLKLALDRANRAYSEFLKHQFLLREHVQAHQCPTTRTESILK
jgi:hypothetical protein